MSSLLNIRYGIGDNIKELIWLFLPMVFLYFSSFLLTQKEQEKELCILSSVHIIYCLIANIVSLTMLWWGRNYKFVDEMNNRRIIGFKWGRLWGVYDDPNHGAVITTIAIFLTIYLILKSKKRIVKCVLALTCVVHIAYIICSDSRTGFVTLGVGTAVVMFWMLYQRLESKKEIIRITASLFAACAFGFIIVAGLQMGYKQYMAIDKKIAKASITHTNQVPIYDDLNASREKNLKEDTTSGRFAIWKSGIEIFEESPIYGVSYRSMAAFAQDNLPETYIINTEYGITYDSMHNVLMDILVSQGSIGLILFFGIIIKSIWLFWKKKQNIPIQKRSEFVCLIMIILGLGAGSMFLTSILYLSGPHAYWFWLCMGCGASLLQGSNTKKKEKFG